MMEAEKIPPRIRLISINDNSHPIFPKNRVADFFAKLGTGKIAICILPAFRPELLKEV